MKSFGEIRQIAYLTDDIEAAMKGWIEKSAVGPFIWYKDLTLAMQYKGELSNVEMQVAIAYQGDMQIELIQQTNQAASPYRAFFEQGRMGLHHIAFVTEDMDQALAQVEAQGFDVIARIDEAIGRYAYYQDPNLPEIFYELLAIDEGIKSFWDDCIEQAKTFDPSNKLEQAITVFDMSEM